MNSFLSLVLWAPTGVQVTFSFTDLLRGGRLPPPLFPGVAEPAPLKPLLQPGWRGGGAEEEGLLVSSSYAGHLQPAGTAQRL